MSLVLRAALLMLCFCVPAAAATDPASDDNDVGVGVICNTSKQVETLVKQINDGKDIKEAVQAVNVEAVNPIACTLAAVAFTTGAPVSQQTLNGEDVAIVEITVYAVSNGDSWQRVPDTKQYTVMPPKGDVI